jgi:hypothetical protein
MSERKSHPDKFRLMERKSFILQELTKARKSILFMVNQLTSEQLNEAFLGIWSVKDLIAHLIGWDITNLRAIQELQQFRLPDFYNHHDPDWSSYNATLLSRHRIDDIQLLLDNIHDSHTKLTGYIETIDAQEIDQDWGVRYKGYRVTIGRLLEAETRDEYEHAKQISRYFGIAGQT